MSKSCPRNQRHLPNTRTTRAGFRMSAVRRSTQRQNRPQFPINLNHMPVLRVRVRAQRDLLDQTPQDLCRLCPRVVLIQRRAQIRHLPRVGRNGPIGTACRVAG